MLVLNLWKLLKISFYYSLVHLEENIHFHLSFFYDITRKKPQITLFFLLPLFPLLTTIIIIIIIIMRNTYMKDVLHVLELISNEYVLKTLSYYILCWQFRCEQDIWQRIETWIQNGKEIYLFRFNRITDADKSRRELTTFFWNLII